jgi:RimJ/RimL family protein N-acetyltransferase
MVLDPLRPKGKSDMHYLGIACNLRLAEVADAQDILRLRLDSKLNRHLHETRDDLAAQQGWIREYKTREAAGSEYYFMTIDKNGNALGTIRIHSIDKDEKAYTSGSWIVHDGVDLRVSVESVLASDLLAFHYLGLLEKRFDVRKANTKVIRFHRGMGAVIVSEDDLNLFFTLSKDSFDAYIEKVRDIIPLGAFSF